MLPRAFPRNGRAVFPRHPHGYMILTAQRTRVQNCSGLTCPTHPVTGGFDFVKYWRHTFDPVALQS